MAEYIRKEDALDAVKHAWAKGIEPSQYIESIEPADVAPVRHARWRHYEGMYACEACDAQLDDESPFCPICGAKMDGERREDTVNTVIPAIVDVADMEIAEGFMYTIEPADVAPVKHTYWMPHRCSACGYPVSRRKCNNNFCPNCGAKLDKRREE